MPDSVIISEFTYKGSTYVLKDAVARAAIENLNSFEYVVCTSASDTPQNVTWSGITGTLEASEDTKYKIYLVPSVNANGDVYDEYLTIQNGNNFTWEKLGNTDIDLSGYVLKNNAVVTNSLSMDRKANTTVGMKSTALGNSVTASGANSFAEGNNTRASGSESHAEGYGSIASASTTHAEGYGTIASGTYAHAEGYLSSAGGVASHAEGYSNLANNRSQHVFGEYNISDPSGANADARGSYIEIVGNGLSSNSRSNARTLDWNGNEYLAGNIFVGCDENSEGGRRLATEHYVVNMVSNIQSIKIYICTSNEYDPITGTPTISYPDMNTFYLVPGGSAPNLYIEWIYTNNAWEQFGSATIDLSNYVQKTDYATTSTAGIVKVGNGLGVTQNDGVYINFGNDAQVKSGTAGSTVAAISRNHLVAFYGLAKAAGDTTQAASSNAVGTYTDAAKTAIRGMIGATSSDIVAVSDTQPTATDNKLWIRETASETVQVPTVTEMQTYVNTAMASAGTVQDVRVNGTSVLQNGTANIPLAGSSQSQPGVLWLNGDGLELTNTGRLVVVGGNSTKIKAGTNLYAPVVASNQHQATFYGLAKAAGVDMASSSNAVGTYTAEALAAIQTMLGVQPGAEVVRLI